MIESVDGECVTDPDIEGGNFRVYSRIWPVMGRAPCTPAWNCGGPLLKKEALRYGKSGNKNRATCFATLLQNELKSDVARFTTHEKNPCDLICCKTGSNEGGKTRNIAIQLVWQQCCKTSCKFFVARFTGALITLGTDQWGTGPHASPPEIVEGSYSRKRPI